MKKLSIVVFTIVIFIVSGCNNKIVDIPTLEEEVPVTVPEEPEVLPDEASSFILYYKLHQGQYEQEKYEPGTYVKFMDEPTVTDGYAFAVVVIDAYGDISSVYLDETYSSRILYKDSNGNIYTFVKSGDGVPKSYRLIDPNIDLADYPTSRTELTDDDLVVGTHDELIDQLQPLQANETKRYLNGDLRMYGGLSYTQQMKLLEDKIIEDQTVYGFELYKSRMKVKSYSLPDVNIDIKNHLQLVKDILDIDAKLSEGTELKSQMDYVKGIYYPGTYVGFSRRELDGSDLNLAISVISVDSYGTISGVYVDETTSSTLYEDTYSTKYALNQFYKLENESDLTWKEQSEIYSSYVVDNQHVENLEFYAVSALGKIFEAEYDDVYTETLYTDSIIDLSINVDLIVEATINAINCASEELEEVTAVVDDEVTEGNN